MPLDKSIVFYDLFCGGFNVGINVPYEKVIASDVQPQLIELLRFLAEEHDAAKIIDEVIRQYKLSKKNKEGYLHLRADYNKSPSPVLFFALITNSFNHQIRFNSSGLFNMPFGKDRSEYNKRMENNLIRFVGRLQSKDITFLLADFQDIKIEQNAFVYADPPYLATTATYNEQNKWTKKDDIRLMEFLDCLHESNIKFMLSNISSNCELVDWAQKYNVYRFENNYANSSYHKKARTVDVNDILVVN